MPDRLEIKLDIKSKVVIPIMSEVKILPFIPSLSIPKEINLFQNSNLG
jgi:hypothetical protein